MREIRQIPALKRAVLAKIVVRGETVVFHLVTDQTYGKADAEAAGKISQKYVPAGCKATANVVKSVPAPEGVRAAAADFLRTRYPAAAAFISPADIEVFVDGAGGRFVLSVGAGEREQFAQGDVLNALSEELMRRFCGCWTGSYREIVREAAEPEEEAPPPAEYVAAPRTFPVREYVKIDGAAPETALYIADLDEEREKVTLCGTIAFIEERMTKKEKPYFSISISDGTGQLRASYFSKAATLEKVRSLKAGDSVCLTGANELFNGAFRFTAKQIDFGMPPAGFVPKARPCRPVPARYVAVFPEPDGDPVQADLFGGDPLPEEFLREKFVVFDLETTGLSYIPAQGAMDHIIEIGAVKIEEGRICEKFSTLVSCPVRIPPKITEITGLDDAALVGAPDLKDVIADFFKFCDGCSLVAHNASFDCGFIRYYGEREGYLFDRTVYDTLALVHDHLRLPNNKLDTVAERFGFAFRHHRAYDDAFVTAKIFIELARMGIVRKS